MTLLSSIAVEAKEAFIAEFAEEASFTPAGGSARVLRGIFDRTAEPTDIGEMVEVDGVAAQFVVATADVPDVALFDAVDVRGFSYRVVGLEPDGTGHTILQLGI